MSAILPNLLPTLGPDEVRAVQPASLPEWDAFLATRRDSPFLASSVWIAALEHGLGYEPQHLASFRAGRLTGCLPLVMVRWGITRPRLVSLPFTPGCGPLSDDLNVRQALYAAAVALARKEHACLRLHCEYEPGPGAGGPAHAVEIRARVRLEQGLEAAWTRLDKETRREIRKAKREGSATNVADLNDPAALQRFRTLFVATNRKHGLPPQPASLFEALRAHARSSTLSNPRLIEGTKSGATIVSLLVAGFGDTLTAIFVGRDYEAADSAVVRCTYWSMIEWAAERGFKSVDLLQSSIQNPGLCAFKRRFGAEQTPLFRIRWSRTPRVDRAREAAVDPRRLAGRVAGRIARSLPDRALIAIGDYVYRYLA